MATTINLAGADAYFGELSHVEHAAWASFDSMLREAAIAQAKRVISRALGSTITDESTDTEDDYRPDYACFEQAFYILRNSSAAANGQLTGRKMVGVSDDGTAAEPKDPNEVCREAKRWLDWQVGTVVRIAKG